jgi:hypothetical protein
MSLAGGMASALAKRSAARSKSVGSEMVTGLLVATAIPPGVLRSFVQLTQFCQVLLLNPYSLCSILPSRVFTSCHISSVVPPFFPMHLQDISGLWSLLTSLG